MNLASNFFTQAGKLMESHIQRQNLNSARPEPITLDTKSQIIDKKSKKEDKEKKHAKMTGYRVFSNERIKELKELPAYTCNLHSAYGIKELSPIVNRDWKNLPSDKVEMYKRIAAQMQEQLDRKSTKEPLEDKKQSKPEKSSSKPQAKEKALEAKPLPEITLAQKLNQLLSKSEKKQKKPIAKQELSDTSSTPSLSEDDRPYKKLKRS